MAGNEGVTVRCAVEGEGADFAVVVDVDVAA